MNDINDWKNKLKEKGIRSTRQRIEILKVLIGNKRPISAGSIYNSLKGDNPRLRLSTVYRNLNEFTKKGITKKIDFNMANRGSCFELNRGEHHHHLICTDCGKIQPIECPLHDFEEQLIKETNYSILDHKIKIYGLCPDCKIDK